MFYVYMSQHEVSVDDLVIGTEYLVKEFGQNHTLKNTFFGTHVKSYGNMVDFKNIKEIDGLPFKKSEIPDSQRVLVVPSHKEICYSKIFMVRKDLALHSVYL